MGSIIFFLVVYVKWEIADQMSHICSDIETEPLIAIHKSQKFRKDITPPENVDYERQSSVRSIYGLGAEK